MIEQLAVEWDFGFKLSEWHTIFRCARVYGSDRDRTSERDLALSWSLFFFSFHIFDGLRSKKTHAAADGDVYLDVWICRYESEF